MLVRSTTTLDGVHAWGALCTNYARRTMARLFRIQRDCMYPKPARDMQQLKTCILAWEERWRAILGDLELGATIPRMWKMAAFLELCPKEVKDQMFQRMDEIGQNYEVLREKVLSYTANKVEHTRGGAVPMEVDNVEDEEIVEDIDGAWRDVICHRCGERGHIARDCP